MFVSIFIFNFIFVQVFHTINFIYVSNLSTLFFTACFAFEQFDKSWLEERNLSSRFVSGIDSLMDWVPDHDFFPFVPGCGKVLGVEVGGELYPFYDHNHASFAMPYLVPFAPMQEWATIPDRRTNSLSGQCLKLTIRLFEELGKLNDRPIRISDIVHARQRVSLPIQCGHKGPLPTTGSTVVSYLSEAF